MLTLKVLLSSAARVLNRLSIDRSLARPSEFLLTAIQTCQPSTRSKVSGLSPVRSMTICMVATTSAVPGTNWLWPRACRARREKSGLDASPHAQSRGLLGHSTSFQDNRSGKTLLSFTRIRFSWTGNLRSDTSWRRYPSEDKYCLLFCRKCLSVKIWRLNRWVTS